MIALCHSFCLFAVEIFFAIPVLHQLFANVAKDFALGARGEGTKQAYCRKWL
jgi:hypothetical protein